jgi:hypothetical protein
LIYKKSDQKYRILLYISGIELKVQSKGEGLTQAYHPSGFRVYCPGGRRDLKPDYRMSGFGPID